MAKKGVKRSVEISAEDLDEIAQRLRRAAAATQALSKALEDKGCGAIEVEGQAMLERAFDSISSFIGNCQKKIREF